MWCNLIRGSCPQGWSGVLTLIVTNCVLFRGADLTAVVREAAIAALRDHMQLQPLGMSSGAGLGESPLPVPELGDMEGCVVQMKHFLTAVVKIKPSVSEKVCVSCHLMCTGRGVGFN